METEKHELTNVYDARARYLGEKNGDGEDIYMGDYYVCTCGEKYQTCGDVLAAFEHGQRTGFESQVAPWVRS